MPVKTAFIALKIEKQRPSTISDSITAFIILEEKGCVIFKRRRSAKIPMGRVPSVVKCRLVFLLLMPCTVVADLRRAGRLVVLPACDSTNLLQV